MSRKKDELVLEEIFEVEIKLTNSCLIFSAEFILYDKETLS